METIVVVENAATLAAERLEPAACIPAKDMLSTKPAMKKCFTLSTPNNGSGGFAFCASSGCARQREAAIMTRSFTASVSLLLRTQRFRREAWGQPEYPDQNTTASAPSVPRAYS